MPVKKEAKKTVVKKATLRNVPAKAATKRRGPLPKHLSLKMQVLAQNWYVTGQYTTYKEIGIALAGEDGQAIDAGTISDWAVKGNWEELRSLYADSSIANLRAAQEQLDALNKAIKESEDGYPNAKQQDAKLKLIKEIQILQGTAVSLSDSATILMNFGRYCAGRYNELFPMITTAQREYLKNLTYGGK